MEIKGKVVLITGASAGIGKVTAELFAREGARLALAARSIDKLQELSAGLPDSFAVRANMTRRDDIRVMVEAVVERYGRIDVLINNAGQGMYTPVEHINIDDMADLMSLNVYGPILAMQAVIPIMRKQSGGAIVNISSGTTRGAFPNIAPYAATKSALNMVTLVARKELAEDGIVVSLVYPGLTATDFRKNAVPSKVPPKQFAASAQLPKVDPPERVALAILGIVQSGAAEVVLYG
jgi:NAD(P)-dependent dehydrogenase (short-subunit alcohol dehydrogenase family)